jgi:hypothetical protein
MVFLFSCSFLCYLFFFLINQCWTKKKRKEKDYFEESDEKRIDLEART